MSSNENLVDALWNAAAVAQRRLIREVSNPSAVAEYDLVHEGSAVRLYAVNKSFWHGMGQIQLRVDLQTRVPCDYALQRLKSMSFEELICNVVLGGDIRTDLLCSASGASGEVCLKHLVCNMPGGMTRDGTLLTYTSPATLQPVHQLQVNGTVVTAARQACIVFSSVEDSLEPTHLRRQPSSGDPTLSMKVCPSGLLLTESIKHLGDADNSGPAHCCITCILSPDMNGSAQR
eukprot:TRINITY_DN1372_c0_g1_i2.p1 TRINITY_DN1372_c0_g1~~TRINITY_DN1372_c0_g1_i2.p1  ORF type:complete len:232 (-),score=19.13 TRINITY_DN1372_c0_g1_i2:432-1127(-)